MSTEELETGVIQVILESRIPDCDHKEGTAQKFEEHSMSRPMNEFRVCSHFTCHRCGFSAKKYLTDWMNEGSKW